MTASASRALYDMNGADALADPIRRIGDPAIQYNHFLKMASP